MALDGIMLSMIKDELKSKLKDARINQIYQPSKDELVIAFRTYGDTKKLLISARADSARVHFTSFSIENPKTPPMLCMLLRKRLCSAKLIDIRQLDFERILFFDFEATNEVGDTERLSLVVEIMGRYSNIILIDENSLVIDAVRRVDMTMTSKRVVLPKILYEIPPKQDKMNILSDSLEDIADCILCSGKSLDKAVLSTIQGVSPIISREIEYKVNKSLFDKKTALVAELENLKKTVQGGFKPSIVMRDDNTVLDMAFMNITQYAGALRVIDYLSFSEMLDSFYYERDMALRMKTKSQDLHRLINNLTERLSKKINIQKAELEKCFDREKLRINGDLIQANLYRIKRGDAFVEVENFYEENSPVVRIPLDVSISPAQNAQRFYKAYAKAKTRQRVLSNEIEKAQNELQYILSVQDFLNRAKSDTELSQLRLELIQQGYIKQNKGVKIKAEKALPPIRYKTSDGYDVFVGRNNRQNDLLTLKTASKSDIWLHTKDIPGSHTIIALNGKEVSDTAIKEAAMICAYHSKAKDSSNVPVDYTKVKNVSKPSGAKPGKVIYTDFHTVYVTPVQFEEIK